MQLLRIPESEAVLLSRALQSLVERSLWACRLCHTEPCLANLALLARAGWILLLGLVRASPLWFQLGSVLRADVVGVLLMVHQDHPQVGTSLLGQWTWRLLEHVLLTSSAPAERLHAFTCLRKAARQLDPDQLLRLLTSEPVEGRLDPVQVLRALKGIPLQQGTLRALLRRWEISLEVQLEIFTPQELRLLDPGLLARLVSHLTGDLLRYLVHLLESRSMVLWLVVLEDAIRGLLAQGNPGALRPLAEAIAVSYELEVGLTLAPMVPPGPEYHFLRQAICLQHLRQGREHMEPWEVRRAMEITQLAPGVAFVHMVGTARWQAAADLWDQNPDECMQVLVHRKDYLVAIFGARFPQKHGAQACRRRLRVINPLAQRLLEHPVALTRGLTYAFFHRCPLCFQRQLPHVTLPMLQAQLQAQTPDTVTPALVGVVLRLLLDGIEHGLQPLHHLLGLLYSQEEGLQDILLEIGRGHHMEYLRLVRRIASLHPGAHLLRLVMAQSFLLNDEDLDVLLLLDELHPTLGLLDQWLEHHLTDTPELHPRARALVFLLAHRGATGPWLQALLPRLIPRTPEEQVMVVELARQRGVLNQCVTICWHWGDTHQ